MSRLDIVIFGATGFTGQHVVRKMFQIVKKYPEITWGVAGRSRTKVEKILQDVTDNEILSPVKIIVADIGDDESLKEMCSQTRVLINCCGPYQHFGEPVVKAAIEGKSHYLDISGEGFFIESMQLKYNDAARDAGVYIISACGFDCIPVDLGVIFLQQNFGGILNSVETYLTVSVTGTEKKGSTLNYGTFETAVYGLTKEREIPQLRNKIYPTELPSFKPKLKNRLPVHRFQNKWSVIFPAADAAVAYRTQRYLWETQNIRPAQVKTYVKVQSFLALLTLVTSAVLMFIFSMTKCTRSLLLSNPSFFTFGFIKKGNPDAEITENTLAMMELFGVGWPVGADVDAEPPTKKVTARVIGYNPGYGLTVLGVVYSAITILKEQDKMPQTCGVLTHGAAFHNTSIIQKLNANDFKFEIIEN